MASRRAAKPMKTGICMRGTLGSWGSFSSIRVSQRNFPNCSNILKKARRISAARRESLLRVRYLIFDRLDADAGDAAGVHFDYGQSPAFEVDALAFFGNVAQAHEQEAGQGFYAAFAGKAPLHLGFEVAQVDGAIHQ